VLRVLGERPGVSVAELSSAAGVAKPVLYNLLETLEQRGEIAREQLPGGSTGYRLASQAPAEPASDVPEPAAEPG
jgi:DNA-binding IclR family transcriptional regulator